MKEFKNVESFFFHVSSTEWVAAEFLELLNSSSLHKMQNKVRKFVIIHYAIHEM